MLTKMGRDAEQASPKSTEELISILERECELRRQNVRIAKVGSVSLVLGLFGLAVFAWLLRGTPVLVTLRDFSAFFLVALGGVALRATHREALLQVLGQDPSLTGFLIEALGYRDAEVGLHAERVLARRLPTSDGISPEHCAVLAARLESSRNLDFVEAALGALRRDGGADCLEGIAPMTE